MCIRDSPATSPISSNPVPAKDDGRGVDVEELMKKIDAKIAELEEEEKQNAAKEKAVSPKSEIGRAHV